MIFAEGRAGDRDVMLTSLRADDSPTLFAWINDPELVRYNAVFSPVAQSDHDRWFARQLAGEPARRLFVIRQLADGPPLGVIQLIDIDPVHRSAELTMRIGSDGHRGLGIGTAALGLVCRHGFEDLGLNRIWLRVFATNGRAIRTYEKAGFQREGVMSRACWLDEAWVDLVVMARLRA